MDLLNQLASADLSKIGHRKLYNYLKANYNIPLVTHIIKAGMPVFRGRSKENIESFNSEFEISYRTDFGNIIEYGRCNKPHQSVFYGCIPYSRDDYAPETTIYETVSEFFDPNKECEKDYITIGMWKTKKDIEVLDISFSEDYNTNQYFDEKQKVWKNDLSSFLERNENSYKLLNFFAKEFSKKDIKSHWDYKLASIYFDIALSENIVGVRYPSVQRSYNGLNLALHHSVVDDYLELDSVTVYELKNPIKPFKIATDLGFMNSNFTWSK